MYKVDLKPHNEQTMEKIIEFFKTSNKCCAIQATGTGKTFLILRLLEMFQNENKNAVIFAPNREIIKQTKNKMKKYGINNAVFYTYQKLSRMYDNEIVNINADLIVCDELHRTGAKTWGIKFESLVDSHPNAKVFGVTATPLRCADGRDMAEEYFDNNKACDISLAEALVRKIIPVMPVYVSALYTFEEEYDNIVDKIEKGRNSDEEKSDLMKELKEAKQQLEKSNGIPEIIKKYITDYNGKYIVFCKDKKHLYDMKDIVIQWFRDAGYNGKIFEYPYYSCSSEVKKNLVNFENNEEEGLKLLFVIDKLNEGLHLDVIHGCILLRTTTSNIIYYQQIGRAIDAGCNQKRVILDLVSNFNSLKSFNLKSELNKKIIDRQNGKFFECSKEFDVGEFHINDYVQECIDVFNKIDSYILNKCWSEEEDNILIENYPTICMGVIDMLDGRTEDSIKGRVRQLGIKYRNIDYWTIKEDDILKQYYPAEGRSVYKRLNGRTASACAGYCKTHGIRKSSYNNWTEEEDDFLIKNYPMEGKKCFTNLKRHTEYQCINRVKKLNVQYIADKWTQEEEQILIKFFPLEGKECFSRIIGRTKSSCEHKISRLGLVYSNTIKI